MSNVIPISIIVPFLNEQEDIKNFLDCVVKMTVHPEAYIFVDSGSTDKTAKIIEEFHHPYSQIKLIPNEMKSIRFPGESRNLGMQAIETPWFAFLDIGVNPDSHWLEKLWCYVNENESKGAVGYCQFYADEIFSTLLCLLSNGFKNKTPALPGSIFHKSILEDVELFDPKLRSCEDIIFRESFLKIYGRHYCSEAIVHYKSYSNSPKRILFKWFTYAFHSAKSGIFKRQIQVYYAFFLTLFLLLSFSVKAGLGLLAFYFVMRGYVLPLKKCRDFSWIKTKPLLIILLPFSALALDFAKLLGFLKFSIIFIHKNKEGA